MPDVVMDEISLDDERRLRAVINRLGLPQLTPGWLKVVSFGRPIERFAYWERYLVNRRTEFVWYNKTDVWLTVNEDAGVLRRMVVSGLAAEKEAKVLRSEAWRTHAASGQSLSPDQLRRLADDVVTCRQDRQYQETFQSCLRHIRLNFKWEGHEVVEGDGFIIPISKLSLRADDVELLRRVFAALPKTTFNPSGEAPTRLAVADEPCPLCDGGGKVEATKETPLKGRKAALATVADMDFMRWVNARLTDEDKAGVWSLTGALYGDYAEWIAKRRDEQTDVDHAESKVAVMSDTAWGTLMGKMFAKGRDGKKGSRYNVRLKKR